MLPQISVASISSSQNSLTRETSIGARTLPSRPPEEQAALGELRDLLRSPESPVAHDRGAPPRTPAADVLAARHRRAMTPDNERVDEESRLSNRGSRRRLSRTGLEPCPNCTKSAERERLALEREKLANQREETAYGREQVANERADKALERERAAIDKERDATIKVYEATQREKDAVTREQEAVSREKEALNQLETVKIQAQRAPPASAPNPQHPQHPGGQGHSGHPSFGVSPVTVPESQHPQHPGSLPTMRSTQGLAAPQPMSLFPAPQDPRGFYSGEQGPQGQRSYYPGEPGTQNQRGYYPGEAVAQGQSPVPPLDTGVGIEGLRDSGTVTPRRSARGAGGARRPDSFELPGYSSMGAVPSGLGMDRSTNPQGGPMDEMLMRILLERESLHNQREAFNLQRESLNLSRESLDNDLHSSLFKTFLHGGLQGRGPRG